MKQQTYWFRTMEELDDILEDIASSDSYKKAKSVLLQLYNTNVNINMEAVTEKIREVCKKAKLTGITGANVMEEKCDWSSPTQLSVSYFSTVELYQLEFDLEETTAFVAGRKLCELLQQLKHPKCMQIFYSCNARNILGFFREIQHIKIPIFGGAAGRSVFIVNPGIVYGQKLYKKGIMITIFDSEELQLYMENNLGWKELGLEMKVTKTEGRNIIREIDHRPATEMYSKYLQVYPNSHFVQNVCEFPIIFKNKNCKVARLPYSFDAEGAMYYNADVEQGQTFHLSYINKEELMEKTRESAEDLNRFNPEMVYLYECGNRIQFLKEQHNEELDAYQLNNYRRISHTIVDAELFFSREKDGGICNSTIVIVGLKEEAGGEDRIVINREVDRVRWRKPEDDVEIPLLDRILHFLETTSKELDERNMELGRIAVTDQLTQVYNRWELERKLEEAVLQGKSGRFYALLFLDIDHFKQVNDTYGHDVGDRVLTLTVDYVRDYLIEGHVFGRWGGEEFLYLLPDMTEEEVVAFAENVRKTVEQASYGEVENVTISIGCTMMQADDTMDSFVKRADDGLYQAKETGRNRVVFV